MMYGPFSAEPSPASCPRSYFVRRSRCSDPDGPRPLRVLYPLGRLAPRGPRWLPLPCPRRPMGWSTVHHGARAPWANPFHRHAPALPIETFS